MRGLRPLRGERSVYMVCQSREPSIGVPVLLCFFIGRMPSFPPGLDCHTPSSETERHERKRRRALSEPTPMDVDGEVGSQFRCSFCNGNRLFLKPQGLNSAINEFDTKDIISRLHPDTSPIYFYDRGKPFFECARTLHPGTRRKRYRTYVLWFRFTNFSLHSIEYDEKIYATSEHRA